MSSQERWRQTSSSPTLATNASCQKVRRTNPKPTPSVRLTSTDSVYAPLAEAFVAHINRIPSMSLHAPPLPSSPPSSSSRAEQLQIQ